MAASKITAFMSTYVLKNNEQLGPFDDAMIFSCLADGRFLYEDLAWREGWARWKQLREIYPVPAAKEPDAAEQKLWTGRPSLWSYLQAWVFGLASMAGGVEVRFAADKGWFSSWFGSYPQWHQISPWLPFIIVGVVSIGLITIFSIFMARLRWQYTITTKRLVTRLGLFAVSTAEIRIQDIRSINVTKTGLSGFLFNIGTVEFSSAAKESADVMFWQIGAPYKVRDTVRKLQV